MAVILWAAWSPLVESIRIREYVGAIGDFTAPVWPVRLIMLIGLGATLLTFVLLALADLQRARRAAAAERMSPSADRLAVAAGDAAADLARHACRGGAGPVSLRRRLADPRRRRHRRQPARAGRVSDAIASHIFGVVPLFVLTGFLVAIADVGKDAFEVANQLFRRLRGGLGVATVAANAVFAAITGISIASAAVFTRVAVPQMLRFGYRRGFAVGVVAGSSVLGMLIPPSLLMILYGFLSDQSVGDMFTAGIVPGLLLARGLRRGHRRAWPTCGRAWSSRRRSAPQVADEALMRLRHACCGKLLPSVVLIVLVLGGLYAGLLHRHRSRRGRRGAGAADRAGSSASSTLAQLLERAAPRPATSRWRSSFLIICANIYTRMLAMSRHAAVPGRDDGRRPGSGRPPSCCSTCAIVIALGTIIDSSSIMLIVLPLMLPIAEQFGMNLVWFGVVTVVAVEIGLLTPPFGLSVFVIKSTLNDPRISLGDIFRGTAPFTLMMLAVLALLVAFPRISLALL